MERQTSTLSFTPVNLTCMALNCGRKPENPESQMQAGRGRTCTLQTPRERSGIRLKTFLLWGDSPITAPPCHPEYLLIQGDSVVQSTVCGNWSQKPWADLTLDGEKAEKASKDDLRVCSGSCWLKSPDRGFYYKQQISNQYRFFETRKFWEDQNRRDVFPHFGPWSAISIWICFAVLKTSVCGCGPTMCVSFISAALHFTQ